jgi:hypothetical protein
MHAFNPKTLHKFFILQIILEIRLDKWKTNKKGVFGKL